MALDDARMEIDGYGVAGSAGSPVFNSEGGLIGIQVGTAGNGRLLAVPASVLKRWLRAAP